MTGNISAIDKGTHHRVLVFFEPMRISEIANSQNRSQENIGQRVASHRDTLSMYVHDET